MVAIDPGGAVEVGMEYHTVYLCIVNLQRTESALLFYGLATGLNSREYSHLKASLLIDERLFLDLKLGDMTLLLGKSSSSLSLKSSVALDDQTRRHDSSARLFLLDSRSEIERAEVERVDIKRHIGKSTNRLVDPRLYTFGEVPIVRLNPSVGFGGGSGEVEV